MYGGVAERVLGPHLEMVYLVFTESSVERPHSTARRTGRWSRFEYPGKMKEHWFWWAALPHLFSSSVMSDSVTHRLQHTRHPCPSLSLGVCSNSCPSMMPSNHPILCHHLLLLPSIFSRIRVFYNELALCIRCASYWSFSFSISPSNGYSGLISFRINWFDLLAVQGTLKRLLQQHSLKPSILWHSAFFMVPSKIIQRL